MPRNFQVSINGGVWVDYDEDLTFPIPNVSLADEVRVRANGEIYTLPASIVVPGIIAAAAFSGSLTEGQTLTGFEGIYSGSPSVTVRWLRGGVPISGAEGLTYLLQPADVGTLISFEATATNAAGQTVSAAAEQGPVIAATTSLITALPLYSVVEAPTESGIVRVDVTSVPANTLEMVLDIEFPDKTTTNSVLTGGSATGVRSISLPTWAGRRVFLRLYARNALGDGPRPGNNDVKGLRIAGAPTLTCRINPDQVRAGERAIISFETTGFPEPVLSGITATLGGAAILLDGKGNVRTFDVPVGTAPGTVLSVSATLTNPLGAVNHTATKNTTAAKTFGAPIAIADRAALDAAIASAVGGEHFSLAAGSYGDLSWTRSDAAAPIRISSATGKEATFGVITVSGANRGAVQFDNLTALRINITTSARRVWVLDSVIQGLSQLNACSDVVWARNESADPVRPATENFLLTMTSSRGCLISNNLFGMATEDQTRISGASADCVWENNRHFRLEDYIAEGHSDGFQMFGLTGATFATPNRIAIRRNHIVARFASQAQGFIMTDARNSEGFRDIACHDNVSRSTANRFIFRGFGGGSEFVDNTSSFSIYFGPNFGGKMQRNLCQDIFYQSPISEYYAPGISDNLEIGTNYNVNIIPADPGNDLTVLANWIPPTSAGVSDIYGATAYIKSTLAPPVSTPFQSVDAGGFSVTYASPPTLAPDTTPAYFIVQRAGFDATGAPTTRSQNLLLTRRTQQLGPNKALLSADKVALSHYVYAADRVIGVTNNSTEVSPKPVASHIRADRRTVGNTIPREWLETVAAHQDGIACVEWIASDGTNSVTVRSPTPVIGTMTGDQYAVTCYRPAADVNISTLADDANITVRTRVIPSVGLAASILDSADQTNLWEFGNQLYRRNVARAAAPMVCYVAVTGGNDTTGVVSTDDAAARAAPLASVHGASLRAQNLNGNVNYLVIRLLAGVHTWAGGASTPRRVQSWGSGEMVIERDPLAVGDVALTFGGADVSQNLERGDVATAECQVRIRNIRLDRTGAAAVRNNATTVRPLHIVWENCVWDFNLSAANLYATDLVQDSCEGVTLNSVASPAFWNFSGATVRHRLMRGVNARAISISGWNVHGCDFNNAGAAGLVLNYASGIVSGATITSSRFEDISSTLEFINFSSTVTGFLLANNVIEYKTAASTRILRLSGDGGVGNTSHIMLWHNTLPGSATLGSNNLFYDETNTSVGYGSTVLRTHKFASVIGNIFAQVASKGDAFVNNAIHIGQQAVKYGVGWRGNFVMDVGNNLDTFRVLYYGRLSKVGPDAYPSMKPGFVLPGHVDDGVSGAGNGNYALTTGALAKAMVENSPCPFDITGALRGTLASAGAYE